MVLAGFFKHSLIAIPHSEPKAKRKPRKKAAAKPKAKALGNVVNSQEAASALRKSWASVE